jgi:tyrosine-protein phosphatase YwqE
MALSTGFGCMGRPTWLVEFPGWWLDVEDAIGLTWAACERIDAEGLAPVLAHPERCRAVAADPASAVRFAERGWPLCLNGPSVLGDHGQTAERMAWWLLGEGTVSLVASDAHGPGGCRCSTSPARRSPNDSAPTWPTRCSTAAPCNSATTSS